MLVSKKTMRPWNGEPIETMVDERVVHYHDGRPDVVEKVEPYPVVLKYPPSIEDVWTDEELAAIGLARVVSFEPPEGKIASGKTRFETRGDRVVEIRDVVDAPEPVVQVTVSEFKRLKDIEKNSSRERSPTP